MLHYAVYTLKCQYGIMYYFSFLIFSFTNARFILLTMLTIRGMTITAHTIGSETIIPQYHITGVRSMAISTFPTSSSPLEKIGVIWSPMP